MTQPQPQNFDPRSTPQNGTPVEERPLSVKCFGLTDRGRVREANEDQFVTASLMRALWIEQSSVPQSTVRYADHRGHVFIVADGMGGAAGGEKASAIAVDAVEGFLLNALRWLLALDASKEASVLRDFKSALRTADACVYAAASSTPELRGMGTTLTMVYSLDADLFVAHAGDSRAYVLRGGAMFRLTRDDTVVQQMLETGLLTPENAAGHELRHIITNVVGGPSPGVQVSVHQIRLAPGDVLLLCTDGLTGMLPDDRIASILEASERPEEACEKLVQAANEQGGTDNVTVIVARYS